MILNIEHMCPFIILCLKTTIYRPILQWEVAHISTMLASILLFVPFETTQQCKIKMAGKNE